ncbi:ATP-binding cassette domain-containing protein, partial [Streptosporangium sp. NPDC001682]
ATMGLPGPRILSDRVYKPGSLVHLSRAALDRWIYLGSRALRSVFRMTNDAVSLKNVTKRFGAVRAVDDLSLDIPAGQTVALLGPNGAGKPTIKLGLSL